MQTAAWRPLAISLLILALLALPFLYDGAVTALAIIRPA
jgi:hypothetical protein